MKHASVSPWVTGLLVVLFFSIAPAALAQSDATSSATEVGISPVEASEGFRSLFDGGSLQGWKLRDPARESWSAEDGMLVNESTSERVGSDILTEEKFGDFTIRLEFMIPEGSNSGLYLRGRKEIQIIDDYKVGEPTLNGHGSIYNHTAVSEFASREAGEWQELEATIIGNRISATLNGVKIHDNVEVDRATGGELDGNVGEPGPVLIQGNHGSITLRNIRIKPIE